jgi:sulfur relay (sulfurtransferase) DsrC/TusE family protein
MKIYEVKISEIATIPRDTWLMQAKSLPEAVAKAEKKRRSDTSTPHYDVCKSKRELAIKFGAIPSERRDFVLKMREIRERQYGSTK